MRWLLRALAAALLLTLVCFTVWESHRRLPPELHIDGAWEPLASANAAFRYDLTAADAAGTPLHERQIDPELLRTIAQARELLVLDAGLFGDLPAAGPTAASLSSAAPAAAALVDALVQARRDQPNLEVLLLIDPSSRWLQSDSSLSARLRSAGVAVVGVDVARLRAPNPAFAALWRLCCAWLPSGARGDWPNPAQVGPAGISFGLWGQLQSSQRSHRQVLIADDGQQRLVGVVFSRPLHAEAAIHSATALRLSGAALAPMLESELVLAQFAGWSGGAMQARAQRFAAEQLATSATVADARARVVSEGAVGAALVQRIDAVVSGESIDVAALYLAQRDVVRALLDAARRGATVRVLLDPGRAAYGYARDGLPNRVVASELVAASDGAIRVRWYRTHGELFSAGFVLIRGATRAWLMVGTAELTQRDLGDRNLAAAFLLEAPVTAGVDAAALSWFDTLWFNRVAGGTEYTSDADVYADASQLHYWQYRVLEASGADFD